MARRGSRMRDLVSGSTFQTVPSGVTLHAQGIQAENASFVTPSILSNLTALAGPAAGATSITGLLVSGDLVNWAGASLAINTGLTSIISFTGVYRHIGSAGDLSGVSPMSCVWRPSATAGIVTAALYTLGIADAAITIAPSGGSLAWMAIGT